MTRIYFAITLAPRETVGESQTLASIDTSENLGSTTRTRLDIRHTTSPTYMLKVFAECETLITWHHILSKKHTDTRIFLECMKNFPVNRDDSQPDPDRQKFRTIREL